MGPNPYEEDEKNNEKNQNIEQGFGPTNSLVEILKKQRVILQGKDSDNHKSLPKVLSECY